VWQLEQKSRVCVELQTPHASPQLFAVFFVKVKAKGKSKVKYKDWLFLVGYFLLTGACHGR